MKFQDTLQDGQTMICKNNYLADILRVCEIKDLIWVMRFQSIYAYSDITCFFSFTISIAFSIKGAKLVGPPS